MAFSNTSYGTISELMIHALLSNRAIQQLGKLFSHINARDEEDSKYVLS